MPRSVRLGIGLMGTVLLWDVVRIFWPGPITTTSVGGSIFTVCVYGGLLYAIASRRNWARLLVGALFVVAVPFVFIRVFSYTRVHEMSMTSPPVAVALILGVLQGAGIVCLFLPSASRWYHHLGTYAESTAH